ncbi:putative tRNA wybutosine-synthesizing protein 2 [Cladorrhinum samala]|uniref:tRNA wybutosine-synthesizing protein 2 n=1 Tax=Cladorrhinum samala TaxID=585594 RepID=A0AAV9I012_9PEZI|nr:putative tRNA wybutosine-synthesizing protein 2 [Cladorrhinum samala]
MSTAPSPPPPPPPPTSTDAHHQSEKPKRPPKPKAESPISKAISSWLDTLPAALLDQVSQQVFSSSCSSTLSSSSSPSELIKPLLLSTAPKRWVIYRPLLLLPSGSFSSSPQWKLLLSLLTREQSTALWRSIVSSPIFEKEKVTHLAINDPIPAFIKEKEEKDQEEEEEEEEEEENNFNNVLRSPTNLTPLYGTTGVKFEDLWVSTRQNGLTQVWAPLYTMFSRGNVKEKARVLGGNTAGPPPSTSPLTSTQNTEVRPEYAVDLYAGIGYFAFSYAKLGYRVLCWELNPHSVEGLRRGALANNFSVRVVSSPEELSKPTGELGLESPNGEGGEQKQQKQQQQIVVFLEDNKEAARRIRELGIGKAAAAVRHVNAGFLPTSQGVWREGFEIVRAGLVGGKAQVEEEKAWLHLHENVGAEDIENRRKEVEGMFKAWAGETGAVETGVEHVELVKTFAPGVWHVVFDVLVRTG